MRVSISTPGLLVFLVEQSGLYFDLVCLKEVSNVVNDLIKHIISENYDFHRMKAKDRWYVCIIQYNNDVELVTAGFLSALDENPVSIEKKEVNFSDGTGGYVKKVVVVPSWIAPVSGKDQVNMKAAFLFAEKIINQWILDRPDTPIPLIINISSGIPFYERKEVSECRKEVIDVVNRVRNLGNNSGNVQIFNVILGGKENVAFPSTNNEIYNEEIKFMYELSTEVPSNFDYLYNNRWSNKTYGSTLINEGARLLCNDNIIDNLRLFIDCQYYSHTGQYND